MYVKIHKAYRLVVAVCDSDIIGKKFSEGHKVLDLRENFYKGEKIEDDKKAIKKLAELATDDATFNIAGKKSVACALKCGLITKEGIKKVGKVPFALVLL